MAIITLDIDDELVAKALAQAEFENITLEAMLTARVAELAKLGGRRLTVREQIYVDCEASPEVAEQLRAEARAGRRATPEKPPA